MFKSTGKYCFVAYVVDDVPDPAIAPLHSLRVGDLARVRAQPLGLRPRDRECRFDVSVLRAGRDVARRALTAAAASHRLRPP